MLFAPTPREATAVSLLLFPVPSGLMDYLFRQGLGIWILPEGSRAEEIAYDHLRLTPKVLEGVGRYPHEHAHYDTRSKSVVVPKHYLTESQHNVMIHEIGHAVDFLFSSKGRVSELRPFNKILSDTIPLDSHCEKQDSLYGGRGEQFATCFEAYFSEPLENPGEFLHSVDDLSQDFIRALERYIVEPFKVKHG